MVLGVLPLMVLKRQDAISDSAGSCRACYRRESTVAAVIAASLSSRLRPTYGQKSRWIAITNPFVRRP